MPSLSSMPAPANQSLVTARQYTLSLLSEYAHTLDALPLDLSRIFADLRELDAVLTATVTAITAKIHRLIEMVENRASATNEQRMWLLGEIAEDAGKVRPGAEDKIRIATHAADALYAQALYLSRLLRRAPPGEMYDMVRMMQRTVYPHVSSRPHAPPPFESGRRRRVAAGGGLLVGAGVGDVSPNKRRRIVQEEDMEYGGVGKTPRKEKLGEGTSASRGPRGGGGGRAKKADRMPSPSESLMSMASPLPGPSSGAALQRHSLANGHRLNSNNNNSNTNTGSSSAKRRGGGGGGGTSNGAHQSLASNNNDSTSLLDSVISRKEHHQSLPPSSSTMHPSLMDSERSGAEKGSNAHSSSSHHAANGKGGSSSSAVHQDRGSTSGQHHHNHHHTDGASSANAARASTQSSLTTNLASTVVGSPAPAGVGGSPATAADDGADGDGEDGQTYCICNSVSYGEMIACDDDSCVREWFHLACVGLAAPPEGTWFCEECTVKRANRRPSRGGKKKGGGVRVNGRSGG